MTKKTSIKINKAFDVFKDILLVLLIGMFAGTVYVFITWISNNGRIDLKEYIIRFVIMASVFMVMSILIFAVKKLRYLIKLSRVLAISEKEGYTDKYYILFEQLIEKEKNYKNKLRLNYEYARELSEGGRYEKSFEVINAIHPICADNKIGTNLLALSIYNCLLNNEKEKAQNLIEKNSAFISKFSKRNGSAFLNLSLGVFEYSDGKLSDAVNYIDLAVIDSKKYSWEQTQSLLYLLLIYKKQGLKLAADNTTALLESMPMTYRQNKDFELLVK